MDIRALAEAGIDLAKGIANQAWKPVTVKLGATASGYDPETETPATTWEKEAEVDALEYDEKNEATGSTTKIFMVKFADLDTEIKPDHQVVIQAAGKEYEIEKSETDPVGATWQFYVKR